MPVAARHARWVLLCPPTGALPHLTHIEARRVGRFALPLHLWEQVVLPWVARRDLLVNLAGSAPAMARRQICMVHDAAVFDRPAAYTHAFVIWYRWLFRRLARRALKLLTVSSFSRERLAAHLHLDAARFGIVPNGGDHFDAVAADASVLAQHGLAGKRFLLAVGSANANKNLPALVSAFAALPPEADLRLVIVGGRSGQVFADAASSADASDPPGLLRLGAIDDAALKALYQHATALVFPSLYEGFGLPPLEAMACGCPVAAARAGATAEVCGEAALYFDPESVDEMSAAFHTLLIDAPLRERLRAAGFARVANFRWSDAAEALLAQITPEADRR